MSKLLKTIVVLFVLWFWLIGWFCIEFYQDFLSQTWCKESHKLDCVNVLTYRTPGMLLSVGSIIVGILILVLVFSSSKKELKK